MSERKNVSIINPRIARSRIERTVRTLILTSQDQIRHAKTVVRARTGVSRLSEITNGRSAEVKLAALRNHEVEQALRTLNTHRRIPNRRS